MPEQLDLRISQIRHLSSLGQHRFRSSAAFFSTRKRDHAVGAKLVASFNDGDVPAMRVGAGREFGFEALVSLAVIESRDANWRRGSGRGLPCFELHQHAGQVSIRCGPADQRHMRCSLENLFALLLRHASQHSEFLTLRLQFLEIRQAMENFLFRLVADRTRVIEDEIGLLDRLHLPIAFLHQRPHDLFRVVDVHLAAESFQVKGFLRGLFPNPRHIEQV